MASVLASSGTGAPTRRRQHTNTEVAEKDDTELRLEKALFGDEAGFLDSLSAAKYGEGQELRFYDSGSEDEVASEGEEDLGGVPDEDLFFLDDGTGVTPAVDQTETLEDGTTSTKVTSRAVWYDSDDDRLTVSLAANTRLRKLRSTEDDDVISGREYIQRLRQQYERLHPPPEWVEYARKKRKMSNGTSHADSDSDVSMDGSDSLPPVKPLGELLRSLDPLTRTTNDQAGRKRRKLRPEVIDIQRTKDVTPAGPSSIDTLQFHPHYPLLLAAGPSQSITLYHISPQPPNPNPSLTSLHIKGTPLHTAAFCAPIAPTTSTNTSSPNDTTQVFFSSRRRYFHTWSLSTGNIMKVTRPLHNIKHDQKTTEHFKLSPCGRYMGLVSSSRQSGGNIHVISTTTSQLLTSCRIDSAGGISDMDWLASGSGFAVVGKNGEVSEFSMAEKRIVARWHDEGSVGSTVLSIGGEDSRWVAIGSTSGIVNIYDRKAPAFAKMLEESASSEATAATSPNNNRPKPTKTLDNLTTPISHLHFSPDGQLLVMASRWKKNALKLVHLPSCTVYRNWPTEQTPLGRVASVAVGGGRSGGEQLWVAVGNEQGGVRLWEVSG